MTADSPGMAKLHAVDVPLHPKWEMTKFEYRVELRMGKTAKEVSELLNRLGADSWRFIAYDGVSYILERWIP